MNPRFEEWMIAQGGDAGTIRSSLSTVRRIESAYGDLDVHYESDRCEAVLADLVYSRNDDRVSAPNPSKVAINGDLYTGLASLRTHLTKYVRFCDELDEFDMPTPGALEDARTLGAQEATFSLERDLQAALRSSIEQLEPGLEIIDGGGEHVVPSGKIDILAKDQRGARVVIELKAVKATRDAIGQTLAYMGDIIAEGPSDVRGILVAPDFDDRSRAAARVVPSLTLVRYSFQFSFAPTT